MSDKISYRDSGVDIAVADATKRDMAQSLQGGDKRVLNKIGAFASLFDGRFTGYEHPVLVLKMEEPGSKQKLAFQHGRIRSVCYDMVNHLVNDIVVMGATPLAVLDAVVCGKLEKQVVNEIVDAVAQACREQGCTLVGGETSEQPGVIPDGTYVLTSSILGVVDKPKIIDGSRIGAGDAVLALASNGLHTNGYSLVRALIARHPGILGGQVGPNSFLEAILKPHTCYRECLLGFLDAGCLHGLAHITGGGIQGNLSRIIPAGLYAEIDLGHIEILPVFKRIHEVGQVDDDEMLKTFNLGVGLVIVCELEAVEQIRAACKAFGLPCYKIGKIEQGVSPQVVLNGALSW